MQSPITREESNRNIMSRVGDASMNAGNVGSGMVEIANGVMVSSHTRPAARKPKKKKGALSRLFEIFGAPSGTSSSKSTTIPIENPLDCINLGNQVIGTMYGYKKGQVQFALQDDQRTVPALLLELAVPTSILVKEITSRSVRIGLECEKSSGKPRLLSEPNWTMYCNGRKTGNAVRKTISEIDLHVHSFLLSVSTGTGTIPLNPTDENPSGDFIYMRAKFERIVTSRDSEALYMMSPDGTGSPDLSIFFLRL